MTKRQDYTTLNKYRYLLDQWNNFRDTEAAAKLADMIVSGELKCTPRKDSKLIFVKNRYNGSTCQKCLKSNAVGDYIFCLNNKATCIACSDDEQKQNTSYKKWIKETITIAPVIPIKENKPAWEHTAKFLAEDEGL